jgi:hypothetical protein
MSLSFNSFIAVLAGGAALGGVSEADCIPLSVRKTHRASVGQCYQHCRPTLPTERAGEPGAALLLS